MSTTSLKKTKLKIKLTKYNGTEVSTYYTLYVSKVRIAIFNTISILTKNFDRVIEAKKLILALQNKQ